MKSKTKKLSNYDYFIKTDTSGYQGEWIAIAGQKIVAHGKDAEIVYKSARRKNPGLQVSLAKVPDAQVMILSFSHD